MQSICYAIGQALAIPPPSKGEEMYKGVQSLRLEGNTLPERNGPDIAWAALFKHMQSKDSVQK